MPAQSLGSAPGVHGAGTEQRPGAKKAAVAMLAVVRRSGRLVRDPTRSLRRRPRRDGCRSISCSKRWPTHFHRRGRCLAIAVYIGDKIVFILRDKARRAERFRR
jgi:hypothetical protein